MPKQAYLDSVKSYHLQVKQAFGEALQHKVPKEFEKANDILIVGMGGSIFGGLVVKYAYNNDKLLVPIELVSEYELPAYADERTLVIATSYSGNTEETLSVLEEASSRGCMVFGITSGGKVAKFIKSNDIEGYIFDLKHNPSKAPRTGLGSTIGSTIGILVKLKYLDIKPSEVDELVQYLDLFVKKIVSNSSLITHLSEKLLGKTPVFIGAEHLKAATYIWRNFYNETSKSIAYIMKIPDMNHHFLDGLQFPSSIVNEYVFVYVSSKLYNERNKKRFDISRTLMKKNGLYEIGISLHGGTRLKEIFELIVIGSFVSVYVSDVNKVDPSTNEKVDFLKKALDR